MSTDSERKRKPSRGVELLHKRWTGTMPTEACRIVGYEHAGKESLLQRLPLLYVVSSL